MAVTESAPNRSGSSVGRQRSVGRQLGVGEEHAAHLEDRDRAHAAVDGDGRMGVMSQAVVVEVRVGEDDRRDSRRRRVVRVEAGDVGQDALGDQLLGRPLRRAAREVAAVGRHERHAQVEQDAGAVVGRDLDAHVADLTPAAMNLVPHALSGALSTADETIGRPSGSQTRNVSLRHGRSRASRIPLNRQMAGGT